MIASVLKILKRGSHEAQGLDVFSGLLLESTSAHSLDGIDDAQLAELARASFGFLLKRPHKRHKVAIRDAEWVGAGGSGQRAASVIEVLTDDMPYVVESVMGEIQFRGLSPMLVFHPIFKVRRYGSDRLTGVIGPGDKSWAAGDQESYVAVIVDRLGTDVARQIVEALDGVLDELRRAIEDRDAMRQRLDQAIAAYTELPRTSKSGPSVPAVGELREAVELLKWLEAGNFTLLGTREYEFIGTSAKADLHPMPRGGLGLLRVPEFHVLRRGGEQLQITDEIRKFYNSPSPLIITKANVVSRIRRRVHLDYIGIKSYTAAGSLVGELRLVGLFTSAAYLQSVQTVPVVRQKVKEALAKAGFPPESHSGRALVDVLESFPRDELFQIDMGHLQRWGEAMLELQLRPRTRVLARRDEFNRFVSVLVFVPRDLYTTSSRERIAQYLARAFSGRISAYYPSITMSPLVRIQFIVGLGPGPSTDASDAELEAQVIEILRTWDDRLTTAVAAAHPAARAAALADAYRAAFPVGYADRFAIERAVQDIERIERLGPDKPVGIDFYRDPDSAKQRLRAAIYRLGMPVPLSERVPVLENMGFRVIDERSYQVRPKLAGVQRTVVLHDMELEQADDMPVALDGLDQRMEECFHAVFRGDAENDLFNQLVLRIGAHWREAAILRAYAAYLRQARAPFSPRYIAETMARYPQVATDILDLFKTRFDPDRFVGKAEREEQTAALKAKIEAALANVPNLDEDRILRRYLNIIMATLRTNAFQRDSAGAPPETIAFKLDSRAIDRLPEPKPYREIWVYSPRVEGIHLRFSPIARGGIRWSDRAQDFRTEVLGLCKAQHVKNTMIVPSGAKGGFVPKQLRRNASRDETMQEGVATYRIFISTLLSLTDNIVEGRTAPPDRVVRHDQDDPYLVVAADKGTATFSDIANEIATGRGFWLGDAFASGGSAGYDHKKIGITARGAWESVKRHFREMDIDIQSTPFSVVGVGDMSGDVFGNGVLLSRAIKLVAAFDHRDIFIDPTPDPASSFEERQRLFQLPRSSWQDYDKAKISKGGGVFSRAAKSIAVSPEMKRALGVSADAVTPAELMQAVLRCEADLLYFGGIGTFVKASTESDDDAGDRANDAIRVNADELRVKVIGEGANLAVTQRGRIEAGMRGVRLNTDFIDNSAGVNTSDQEVNIKIALAPAMGAGRLSRADRDALLAGMTEEVAAAVLANNYQQSLALSLAERASRRDVDAFAALARALEERGLIERRLEALPTGTEFAARREAGKGLTRSELAVLLSWAKIALNADLLASDVPENEACRPMLVEYFPSTMRERFKSDIVQHRLGREIIATRLTNSLINRGGPDVVVRLAAESGRGVADITSAFLAARSIFALPELWAAIDALDTRIAGSLQLDLYGELQAFLIEQMKCLLDQPSRPGFDAMIAAYRPAVEQLGKIMRELPAPRQRASLERRAQHLSAGGVPADLAQRIAGLDVLRQTLPLATLSAASGNTVERTASVVLATAEYFRRDELDARAAAVKIADDWDRQAREAALRTIAAEQAVLVTRLLDQHGGATTDLAGWIGANASRLATAKATIDAVLDSGELTVSRLTVAADEVRGSAGG